MPTPARTSLEAIIAAGRQAVAEGGLQALTMERVARAVGVRAPSLYKRVRNRSELARLIMEDVLRELGDALDAAATTGHAGEDLRALARAVRTFAKSHPNAFGLLFTHVPDASRPDAALLVRAVQPMLRATTALTGDRDPLPAARTLTAWVTGFVRMEMAGAFQLSGDVEEAFEYGLDRLLRALASD